VPRAAHAAALLAVALACSRGSPPSEAGPRPVARVNGEPVAAAAVRSELAQLSGGEGAADPALARRALDAVVERTLLLQEARARRLAVSAAEVEAALAALREEYPGKAWDELLAAEKTTPERLRERLGEQLLVERVAAAALEGVQVSDGEVRAYYDANAEALAEGERVRALQIVTRTQEEAEKARAEVAKRPASFADVARRRSIGPEARAGGDLGWFGKDSGMPEVFAACFTLKKDELSKVIASPYGFHVFKVVERRPAARRPFEAVAAEIGQRLLREKRARAQEELRTRLAASAKIEIDEAALEAAVRTP
jgi:peptidyl-prolyl cis-trans isomerase C